MVIKNKDDRHREQSGAHTREFEWAINSGFPQTFREASVTICRLTFEAQPGYHHVPNSGKGGGFAVKDFHGGWWRYCRGRLEGGHGALEQGDKGVGITTELAMNERMRGIKNGLESAVKV